MKKVCILAGMCAAVVAVATLASCVTNPGVGPNLEVDIPELFSPDPDIPNDTMSIGITVSHPAPIKDWAIEIQPNRGGQRPAVQEGEQRQPREGRAEGAERGGAQRRDGRGQGRRRIFFEQTKRGEPPKEWKWDGKGNSGEMVQSATAYRFTLTVTDKFGNSNSFEGIIEVDVLVRREGENLRIIVPSIVFPADSADLSQVSEDEMRANRRVIRLIANALTKYEDYAITVEGHANPTTPPGTEERTAEEASDQELSEQRAAAVMNSLVNDNGIDGGRLTSVGMSCKQPVADYEDDDENWKNRRVEFLLSKG